MVDTVTASKTENVNDDSDVAANMGEFDKRTEQQEKPQSANQVSFINL